MLKQSDSLDGDGGPLAFFSLANETPLHSMAMQYFQACADYAQNMKYLVDRSGAESVTLSKIYGGFYFRDGEVPQGWKKNPGAVHYSPPASSAIYEEYMRLRPPYPSQFVGHSGPVWKDLPGNPPISAHVCQLGPAFILALEKRSLNLIPPDLSPLKNAMRLNRSQLAAMKALAPEEEQRFFTLDRENNSLDYNLPKQIALSPAFAISAETAKKIEMLENWQNSKIGRITESVKTMPLRIIIGLAAVLSKR